MNDAAQNVGKSRPSGTPEANQMEPNYPWLDPNRRSRVDPSPSSPTLSSGSLPVEPLYPWQTGYQKAEQGASQEPERPLQPMSRELMPFGQRIRELRRARGWTQRQAGYALGVSTRTVIRHEKGRTRRPWWSLLVTVRRLEEAYPAELVAYRAHWTP